MKRLITHIMYRTLGVLLVVLTVAPAMAQKPMQNFEVGQCETMEFSVVDWHGDRYTWDLYRDSTVNFAKIKGDVDPVPYFEKGMYEGSTVRVHWLEPGRYFLRIMVWDEVECTNNLLMYLIDVTEVLPEAEIFGDSTCIGVPAIVKIIFTGHGPWDVSYTYGDGTNIVNLIGITEEEYTISMPPLPIGITEFWVTEIIDQCTSNLVPSERGRVVIFPKPTNSKIYLKE
jgi:hypothetical protein